VRSGDIDDVYIGLPNSLHHDYSVRALRRGVHVLCDKPLALDVRQAAAMIAAAKAGRAKLMTAYRLQFEPANLAALDMIHSGKLGEPRFFSSDFSRQVKPGNVRLKGKLGGGRSTTSASAASTPPLLMHFSDCILRNRPVVPSGEEGLADLRVVEAIQRALTKEKTVLLAASRRRGPKLGGRAAIRAPAHKPPRLLGAEGPSQK